MSDSSHHVGFSGRDQVSISYHWEGDQIRVIQVQMKGALEFLRETRSLILGEIQGKTRRQLRELMARSEKPLSPLFTELMELLLGQCTRPYQDEELCHCRVVPTQKVIEAIHYGANTTAEVARRTSAGTGCGTCQIQSEKLIRFYLRKS